MVREYFGSIPESIAAIFIKIQRLECREGYNPEVNFDSTGISFTKFLGDL
jgi:hypothetical protein